MSEMNSFEFVLPRETFVAALAHVVPVAAAKATLPVLSTVLITKNADGLVFTASDLDRTLTISIRSEGGASLLSEAPVSIALPAKRLLDVVSHLPPGPVTVHATSGRSLSTQTRARVSSGRSRFELSGFSAEDFPQADPVVGEVSITFATKDLVAALARASTHVSSEESRPVMQGVLLDARDDGLFVVATDNYRFVREKIADATDLRGQWIIAKDVVPVIASAFSARDTVEFRAETNRAMIVSGDRALTVRLIPGPYPPYEKLLAAPTKDGDCIVDRALLAVSLKRTMALHDVKRVSLEWSESELTIRAGLHELGGSNTAEDVIPCSHKPIAGQGEDGPPPYDYNPKYLLQTLALFSAADVVFSLTGPRVPTYVRDAAAPNGPILAAIAPVGIGTPQPSTSKPSRAARTEKVTANG